MANIIANWATVSGFVAATSTKVSVAGTFNRLIGSITSAVFTISRSGVTRTVTVTQRTHDRPQDSVAKNPLLSSARQVAPFLGYHAAIDLTPFSDGPVSVSCTLTTSNNVTKTLPVLTILNNTGGQLPRPSFRASAYVSPTGNDLNAGTRASPFRSINRALQSVAGSDIGGTEVGGGTIYLMDGDHDWMGAGGGSVFRATTAGDYWLTITNDPLAVGTPRILSRTDVMYAGSRFRIRFYEVNFATAPSFQAELANQSFSWFEGCTFASRYNRLDMREFPFEGALNTPSAATGFSYHTSCSYTNVGNGPLLRDLVRDVLMDGVIGIMWQLTGGSDNPQYSNRALINVVCRRQRMFAGVGGYAFPANNEAYTVTVNTANGTATITNAAVGGSDLRLFNEATVQFGFRINIGRANFVSGSGWSASNEGQFTVVSTGVLGDGRTFMVVQNTGAVAQTTTTNTSISLVWDPHPDILQVNTSLMTNTYMQGLRVYDVANAQGYFGGGQQMTDFAMENCTSHINGNNWFVRGPLTNVLIRNCTFGGPWLWGELCPYIECEFTNNIYNAGVSYYNETSQGGAVSPSSVAAAIAPFAAYNHFSVSTPPLIGSNQTTGSIVQIDTVTGAYTVPATSPAYGSALALDIPVALIGSPPTRGAWVNAATGVFGAVSQSQTVAADLVSTTAQIQLPDVTVGQSGRVLPPVLPTTVAQQAASVGVVQTNAATSLPPTTAVYQPAAYVQTNVLQPATLRLPNASVVLFEPTIRTGQVVRIGADMQAAGVVAFGPTASVSVTIVAASQTIGSAQQSSTPTQSYTHAGEMQAVVSSLQDPLGKVSYAYPSDLFNVSVFQNNAGLRIGFGAGMRPPSLTADVVLFQPFIQGVILVQPGWSWTTVQVYVSRVTVVNYVTFRDSDNTTASVVVLAPFIKAAASVFLTADSLYTQLAIQDPNILLTTILPQPVLSTTIDQFAPSFLFTYTASSLTTTLAQYAPVVAVAQAQAAPMQAVSVLVLDASTKAGSSQKVAADTVTLDTVPNSQVGKVSSVAYPDTLSVYSYVYSVNNAQTIYAFAELQTLGITGNNVTTASTSTVVSDELSTTASVFAASTVAGSNVFQQASMLPSSVVAFDPTTTRSGSVVSDTVYVTAAQQDAIGDNSVYVTYDTTPEIGLETVPFTVSAELNSAPAVINTGLAREISQLMSLEQRFQVEWRVTFDG